MWPNDRAYLLRQSGLSVWLNGQFIKMPAPQGLSMTKSHLPSACLRNTSELVPSMRTGAPSGPFPLSVQRITASAMSPAVTSDFFSVAKVGFMARNPISASRIAA